MQNFQDWINQPFSATMSAPKWFAFVGLLLAIMMIWGVVLRHLTEV